MPPKKRERSPSSTPVPSTEATQQLSTLPDAEWQAMQRVLTAIYSYRTPDGFDPSKLFHKKVNKRVIPEYYDTIQEPIALSTVKQKIHQRSYTNFAEFVRDFALIPHNAQVFNRPDSGAFQDALVIKEQLEKQLQLLVDAGIITREVATLPDLGEIPTYEAPLEDAEGEADEDEDSDEEGEEDDEDADGGDDDEETSTKRKYKKRGPKGGAGAAKQEGGSGALAMGKRPRGRPPKLLTPMEARIQAILKGMRKPKDGRGRLMIKTFDRLPDKATMPEYYAEVAHPIAYDALKRKVKRKKYRSVDDFMADVNLMFANAKQYNTDESQIYRDAVALHTEASRLHAAEMAKPDSSFADDEGKLPMPAGILHHGELYKVGDWVHLRNPNDLTKPTVAQIYRTFRNAAGVGIVNVCWYYRPEQTVHRFDKHFLAHEVVKTGRYRDHLVDEIEGRCFVMFCTRYFKGRPRGLPEGMDVYVCEARYNETAHQFNKIKTWASCQPDEVRDKDYEMDMFDHPRKTIKYPSPIAYLLKPGEDDPEDAPLPKVTWGADGAPPRIGAVHRRPRGEKDSLPPAPRQPTPPPPPPKAPTPLQQQHQQRPLSSVSHLPNYHHHTPANVSALGTPRGPPVRPVSSTASRPSYTNASHPQTYGVPPRPASAQQHLHSSYGTPQTPHLQAAGSTTSTAPRSNAPASAVPTYHHHQPSVTAPSYPSRPTLAATPSSTSYREPAPPPPTPAMEVYTLPDQANLSIPAEVREQYAKDDRGRVLFFIAPPVVQEGGGVPGAVGLGHSVRFLAARGRKRERGEIGKGDVHEGRKQKSARVSVPPTALPRPFQHPQSSTTEAQAQADQIAALTTRALGVLEAQLREAVRREELDEADLRGQLAAAQETALERARLVARNRWQRVQGRTVDLGVGGGLGGVCGDD